MSAGGWLVLGIVAASRMGNRRKHNDRVHARAEVLRAEVLPAWDFYDAEGNLIEEEYEMTASEWAALAPVEDTEPMPVVAPDPAPAKPRKARKPKPAPVEAEREDAPTEEIPLPEVAPAPEAKPKAPKKAPRVHRDPAPAKVAPTAPAKVTLYGSGTDADAATLARYVADLKARKDAA